MRARDGSVLSGGGRVLTAHYPAPIRNRDGSVMQENGRDMTYQAQLTIMDNVAYSQLDSRDQQQMEMVQSKSGGTYYVRRPEVHHNEVRDSYKRSHQVENATERFKRKPGKMKDRDNR